MSESRVLLALLSYPLIVIVVFDWFGQGTRWAGKHRGMHWPPQLKLFEEKKGRILLIGKYGLLLLVLRGLAGTNLWHTAPTAAARVSWLTSIGWGLCGGLLIFGCRRLFSLFSQPARDAERNDHFLRGPSSIWLLIFLIGGIAEECWRELCITSFDVSGYPLISANLLAALAFSIAHVSGLPARIAPGVASILAEMMVGLLLGSLFIHFGDFVIPYVAGVIYFICNFFFTRRTWCEGKNTLN